MRDYGGAPAGLGFSLENRLVMSQLFPRLYHITHVRRIAPFFRALQQAFIQQAGMRENEGGIVLYSSGAESPLYFEHALLSRYLDYPLVEGEDLAVRNGNLYLKKLEGLERVRAVFRHQKDLGCDPFVTGGDIRGGVPGLFQVCREQRAVLTNPLGSGFVDTPLLGTLLGEIAPVLSGNGLLLQGHNRWWCGRNDHLEYVNNNRNLLTLISSMVPGKVLESGDGISPNREGTKVLASEPVIPSYAPIWSEKGRESGCVLYRVFACASEDGFEVMPGGLAITATDIHSLLRGKPEQQQSKDIWVFAGEPERPFSMLSNLQHIGKFKRSSDLTSRVADNFFWMGRYLERAETIIRMMRPVYSRIAMKERPQDMVELQILLKGLQESGVLPDYGKEERAWGEARLEDSLLRAIYDSSQATSLISVVGQARRTAENLRDRLSHDTTRIINMLDVFAGREEPLELLDKMMLILVSFSGFAAENMTRSMSWRFLDMGKRLERAFGQTSLIRCWLRDFQGNLSGLYALLEVSDSLITYRGRYRSSYQFAPVLDLLLMDENNPKSLIFQLEQLAVHTKNLPGTSEVRYAREEERQVLKMLTMARLIDVRKVESAKERATLVAVLRRIENMLERFSQQVTAHYLTRVEVTPHYGSLL